MGSLFPSTPRAPRTVTNTVEVPRPVVVPQTQPTVRMPTETDPDILSAAQRSRASARRRKGRLSTILTDRGSGSSGTKLGA